MNLSSSFIDWSDISNSPYSMFFLLHTFQFMASLIMQRKNLTISNQFLGENHFGCLLALRFHYKLDDRIFLWQFIVFPFEYLELAFHWDVMRCSLNVPNPTFSYTVSPTLGANYTVNVIRHFTIERNEAIWWILHDLYLHWWTWDLALKEDSGRVFRILCFLSWSAAVQYRWRWWWWSTCPPTLAWCTQEWRLKKQIWQLFCSSWLLIIGLTKTSPKSPVIKFVWTWSWQ